MSNATGMKKNEVLDYLKEQGIEVFLSFEEGYDKDGNSVSPISDEEGQFVGHGEGVTDIHQYWGFSGQTGFSTFDVPMTEEKAQYASALFYRLVNEHNMHFEDAEKFSCAFVHTYKVMQEPMTEEEQEEIRKRMIDCIDAGNMKIAGQDDQ